MFPRDLILLTSSRRLQLLGGRRILLRGLISLTRSGRLQLLGRGTLLGLRTLVVPVIRGGTRRSELLSRRLLGRNGPRILVHGVRNGWFQSLGRRSLLGRRGWPLLLGCVGFRTSGPHSGGLGQLNRVRQAVRCTARYRFRTECRQRTGVQFARGLRLTVQVRRGPPRSSWRSRLLDLCVIHRQPLRRLTGRKGGRARGTSWRSRCHALHRAGRSCYGWLRCTGQRLRQFLVPSFRRLTQ